MGHNRMRVLCYYSVGMELVTRRLPFGGQVEKERRTGGGHSLYSACEVGLLRSRMGGLRIVASQYPLQSVRVLATYEVSLILLLLVIVRFSFSVDSVDSVAIVV